MKAIKSPGRLGLVLLLLAGPAAAQTPAWTVEPASQVGFVATQGGSPVEGAFERFQAEIAFSPDDLEASKVVVVIEIASVESGSKDRDDTIRAAGLFDAATWPTARFEATRFLHREGNDYEAQGQLTMRDVTRDVVLPFTLEIAPHPEKTGHLRARARGELTVKRLDYGVGQGLWQDTSVVADEVTIVIDLKAERPAS